ncbi:peptide-methionine (S)-S-oxide reductase [Tremella mesenterica]|uniref:peptide-methionine (S)-S-oxide reductase n=1 Tax=Tremella mesenterica TaxID=5217 RepID=A0A4Q1BCJ2_TREME|nr:uncharacterized protein TREMEDRAFT_55847 [Tremella mesenterica DSM 1558]EIW72200.1 hypothetical protein TREMEDRAFT_55847 [Tremella mesenterica DSM 1558]RXK36558.1 peptide-methionine (S)-S-oxide reductase [Tremella mesenterica]
MSPRKAPPAPTLPTAIRTSQEARLGDGIEYATFAAGCFWGVEHMFNKHYSHLPNWSCVSGYTGGQIGNPNYQQVCSGATGHAESVRIGYQKGAVGYGELVEFFYRTHDPTSLNRQGPDSGTQYRSTIFYHSPEQKQIAEQVTLEVKEKYYPRQNIATQIVPAGEWFDAEAYHQKYLDNNPGGYECPTHQFYW